MRQVGPVDVVEAEDLEGLGEVGRESEVCVNVKPL